MRKIKSFLVMLLASAAATAALTVGAMAATGTSGTDSTVVGNVCYDETYAPDISKHSDTYSRMKGAEFEVNGKEATVYGKSGYKENLKRVSIHVNGSLGSKLAYDHNTNHDKKTVQIVYNGTMTKALYTGSIYDGTTMASLLSEYQITVIQRT